ncbi:MAG TPA: hypothetical protein VGF69_22590 [Thermoanaerobaculia bacterium]
MKTVLRILLVLLFSTAALADDPKDIPDFLRSTLDDELAWVAADAAVNERGQIREELFLLGRIDSARRIARRNGATDECRFFSGPPTPEHFKPTNSLDTLLEHSETIVSAKVMAIRQGFYYGIPGSLLRLNAKQIRGKGRHGPLYLFYQLAKIPTAEGLVCSKPLGEFVAPAVGDRMLIYSLGSPEQTDSGEVIWVDASTQLIHESRGERLVTPKALQETGVTFDLFERRTTDRNNTRN